MTAKSLGAAQELLPPILHRVSISSLPVRSHSQLCLGKRKTPADLSYCVSGRSCQWSLRQHQFQRYFRASLFCHMPLPGLDSTGRGPLTERMRRVGDSRDSWRSIINNMICRLASFHAFLKTVNLSYNNCSLGWAHQPPSYVQAQHLEARRDAAAGLPGYSKYPSLTRGWEHAFYRSHQNKTASCF